VTARTQSSPKVRAYHLLPSRYAIDNLRHRRLKIARIDDLNDPFELWAFAQSDRRIREALGSWKRELARRFGIVCFSLSWHDPLLWSHYAERHHGIALGFDLNDKMLKRVSYVEERPHLRTVNLKTVHRLLATKYIGWKYEDEVRVFTSLEEQEPTSGLYFAAFNEHVVLREIVIGPLSTVTKGELEEVIGANRKQVKIIKARLAFRTFNVVRVKRRLR
jgi:Protein of unknown function (DUF2971)